MALRVRVEEVKELIDTTRNVTIFIETADLIVTENLVGKGLTPERLRIIELYLAAHFIAITEERGGLLSSEKGESREKYAIPFDKGLAFTRYGQTALSLDTTGTLVSMSKTVNKAEFRVV